jgi:two-component system, cell cycle sensor histidine kinase and response regulator CckA
MANGGRILLVMDDERTRKELGGVLRQEGYEVREAGGTPDALRIAEDYELDLLVCDVLLPGAPGTELAIRLCRQDPDLEVLLLSGYVHDVVAPEREWRFARAPFAARVFSAEVEDILEAVSG